MDNIAQRLGLVIHWAGFLVTALYLILAILDSFKLSDGLVFYFDELIFDHILQLYAFPILISFLLGWLIRFILVGKVHILPWK
jgi:hypothetical protein